MSRQYGQMARRRRDRVLAWQKDHVPMVVTCPGCGKKAFESRKDAKHVAAQWIGRGYWSGDGRPRAYECSQENGAGHWHVTSISMERIEWYREHGKEGTTNAAR